MEYVIDIDVILSSLQGIVKELQDEKLVSYDNLSQRLMDIAASMPTTFITKPVAVLEQIEQAAVDLWNITVTRKVGRSLPALANAKLRHVACCLVRNCNLDAANESAYRKQLQMSLKSARAWLDAGDPSMACGTLDLVEECVDRLRQLIRQSSLDSIEPSDDDKMLENDSERHIELDQNLIRCLSYRAECVGLHYKLVTAFMQENSSGSLQYIKKAELLAAKLSNENGLLAVLCYNFGVSCYEKHRYEEAIMWLKESHDVGQIKNSVAAKTQAKTLRLLATCYLEWNDGGDHCDMALNAINLANAKHCPSVGLFLKLQILLNGSAPDNTVTQVESFLQHPDVTVAEALGAADLIFKHDRHDLAFSAMKQIGVRFQRSLDLWKVSVALIDMTLRAGRQQTAQALVEDIIVEQETGSIMDILGLRRIHQLLWDQAAQMAEAKQHSKSLAWYHLSHRLASVSSSIGDESLAKLHRNMASAHLELGQLPEAEQQLVLADKKQSASTTYTFFLKYKLAVLRDDRQAAVEALMSIDASNDVGIHSLVSLAAQFAFENSKPAVAVRALESVVSHTNNSSQLLTALRCLIRLKVTSISEGDKAENVRYIVKYIERAYSELSKMSSASSAAGPAGSGSDSAKVFTDIEVESTWFLKIAWNVALQCDELCDAMCQLYVLCYSLTGLCPLNASSLGRQKTCQLMAAAACLQLARTEVADNQTKLLNEALSHVQQCRLACDQLHAFVPFSADPDTTSPILLVMYEFEAKAKLGSPDTEKILDSVLSLPQTEPKVFEAIAELALEAKRDRLKLAVKALKVTINKHLQMEKTDFNKCSKVFRSLLDLTMPSGRSCTPDAWTYYSQVVEIIETRAQNDYPAFEVLWLMTRGWNCGLQLFSCSKKADGMRWCEMAMRLLNFAGTLKETYSNQMTTAYGELLTKMD